MSAATRSRRVVRLSLRVETPFRIGAAEASPLSDAPVLRDHQGHVLIEGTSLAGLMRGFLERETRFLEGAEAAVTSLFGARETKSASGGASRLSVDSVILHNAATRTRDHVAIDRGKRAARDKLKFDAEVVVAGQAFDLWLSIEPVEHADERLLGLLKAALEAGRLALGGRSASGHGRLHLREWREADGSLADGSTLAAFLGRNSRWDWVEGRLAPRSVEPASASPTWAWKTPTVASDHPLPFERPNSLMLEWRLRVLDPLLVKEGLSDRHSLEDLEIPGKSTQLTIDRGPFQEPALDGPGFSVWVNGKDQSARFRGLVVPGSSIRGALRSRAEKILRTLGNPMASGQRAACDPLESGTGHPLQSCAGRLRQNPSDPARDRDEARYVHERLCLACRTFGSTDLRGRARVEDVRPVSGSRIVLKLIDHVAIDRFTGGAARRRKFNALAIASGEFAGRIALEGVEPWQLGLLALLFRDLWEEDLPLGSGTSRGYGRIRAWPTGLTVRWPAAPWEPLEELAQRLEVGCSEHGAWKQFEWKAPTTVGPVPPGADTPEWKSLLDVVGAMSRLFPEAAP